MAPLKILGGFKMGRKRRQKQDLNTYHAEIEGLSHEGRGIARIEGKATFIFGALPGEKASFQYVEKKKQFDSAKAIEIENPSADRVKPPCSHFDVCGGCALQHLALDKQLSHKEKVLKELFFHAKVSPKNWLPALSANHQGYRHKARLSVRYVEKKGQVLIGFRERFNGRFIAAIDACHILHPSVGQNLPLLQKCIEDLEGAKVIAQIEMAVSDNTTVLILRNLEPLSDIDINYLKDFEKKHSYKLYLQPKGPDSIIHLDGEKGMDYLSYPLPELDLTYQFMPTDFTQVNPSMNEKMVIRAIELLDLNENDAVLDLFSGLGNFSLAIAKSAKSVTGVEGCQQMTLRASENAKLNGLTNTHFVAADLTQPFKGKAWAKTYDKILIDPPRSGAKEIVEQIEVFSAKLIVYVACSPATLARDAGILVHQKGYKLINAGVMDMFPHTSHVESIALFVKE